MGVPETTIVQRDAASPRTAATNTGVWFVAGITDAGTPGVPFAVQSLAAFSDAGGSRAAGAILFDSLEAYFRCGGHKAYVVPCDADAVALDFVDALDALDPELGPGQVSVPGVTVPQVHTALLAHAATHNRVALIDVDDDTAAAVATDVAALRSDPNAAHGAVFAPWALIPGLAPGTTREVPYSAVQAGLIAARDAVAHPNSPAAGPNGIAPVVGLKQTYSKADRATLANAGVCAVRQYVNGEVRTFGYRTLASEATAPLHSMLSNVRLDMAIAAEAEAIGDSIEFAQVDADRRSLASYEIALAAMCAKYHRVGALWGRTPDEAFRVDATSEAVNPVDELAKGNVRSVISIRRSPFAEAVAIEIVHTPITQEV